MAHTMTPWGTTFNGANYHPVNVPLACALSPGPFGHHVLHSVILVRPNGVVQAIAYLADPPARKLVRTTLKHRGSGVFIGHIAGPRGGHHGTEVRLDPTTFAFMFPVCIVTKPVQAYRVATWRDTTAGPTLGDNYRVEERIHESTIFALYNKAGHPFRVAGPYAHKPATMATLLHNYDPITLITQAGKDIFDEIKAPRDESGCVLKEAFQKTGACTTENFLPHLNVRSYKEYCALQQQCPLSVPLI